MHRQFDYFLYIYSCSNHRRYMGSMLLIFFQKVSFKKFSNSKEKETV